MVAGGAVVFCVGLSQRRGALARNHLAGLRTREALASDEAWEAAHDAADVPLMVAGGVWIATGLGLFVIVDVGTALVLLGIGTVVVLALVVEPGCGGSRSHVWSTATPGTKGPSLSGRRSSPCGEEASHPARTMGPKRPRDPRGGLGSEQGWKEGR